MDKSNYRVAHLINAWQSATLARGQIFRIPEALADLRDLGYDGIFADAADLMHFRAQDLKNLLADHELELASLVVPVTANQHAPNEAAYRAGLELAAEMGITTVCVCGGFSGVKRRAALDKDYAEFGANYRRASDFAESLGIRLAFHPHRKCLVETTTEVARLEKHVPELNLHVDTGHLFCVGEDPLDLIESRLERTLQVALKDWNPSDETFAGLGTGEQRTDLGRLAALLPSCPDFDGWLYVEHDACAGSAKGSARKSLETLKHTFAIT